MNGSLVVDYSFELVAGDLKPTYMTVSYGGQSYSGPIDDRAWNMNFQPQPDQPPQEPEAELDDGTAAAISLMQHALTSLASPTYYSMLDAANGEMQAQGWIGCGSAIIGWLVSGYAMVVGCTTVILCIGLIALHQIAVAGMVCSCAGDC